jgi:WD40 repeat protein
MRVDFLVLALIVTSAIPRGSSHTDAHRSLGEGGLIPDVPVSRFAICPDGRSIAVLGDSKSMLIDWPGGGVRPASTDLDRPPCAAVALGFSPDGRLYARPTASGAIAIVDAATNATSKTLTGHLSTVRAAVFSPDGRWLASGGFDNDIRIWDVTAATCARTVTLPSHATFALVWAPEGKTFYTGGAAQTVTAWNAATGERLRDSASLGRPVNYLAVSADGRRLVAGTFTADGTRLPADLRVLDAQTFAEERVIPSPQGGVVSAAFSPDGRQVLWAARDGRGIMVTGVEP